MIQKTSAVPGAWAVWVKDLGEPPVLSAQLRRDSSGQPMPCHCAAGRLVPLRATLSESVSFTQTAQAPGTSQPKFLKL